MTNEELQALCDGAPTQLMCQAFRPGCENVATTFERGYALCVRCAREFLGYTPDVITYPIAFYDAARTELPRLLAENARLRPEAAANGDTANQWRQAHNDQVIRTQALELEIAQLQQANARLHAENKRLANDAYRSTRVVGADEAFYQVDP